MLLLKLQKRTLLPVQKNNLFFAGKWIILLLPDYHRQQIQPDKEW